MVPMMVITYKYLSCVCSIELHAHAYILFIHDQRMIAYTAVVLHNDNRTDSIQYIDYANSLQSIGT